MLFSKTNTRSIKKKALIMVANPLCKNLRLSSTVRTISKARKPRVVPEPGAWGRVPNSNVVPQVSDYAYQMSELRKENGLESEFLRRPKHPRSKLTLALGGVNHGRYLSQ
jgi:hypothetical protein